MNSTKRRLHVLHTESIYSRGGEKYLFELLKRVGGSHDVTLHLHRISPHWRSRYNDARVQVKLLWTPPKLFWLLLPLTLIVNYVQLKRTVKHGDVLFATNFPMNFLSVIISSKAICHCFEPLAIFYDPIRISSLTPFSRFCVAVAKFFYAHLDKWAYTTSAILTSLGPSVEQYIMDTYGRKPDVYLPNGVDCTTFSYTTSHRSRTRRFLLGHSTDYTIFKGTEDFLGIISYLHSQGLPVRAVISESIPDRDVKIKYARFMKRAGINKLVKFIGNVKEQDLPKFYRSLDFFVYTGSPECAGGSTASLSVLEAQSCGTPVIRSRGDDREILHGKTGFYIDPHNHSQAGNILTSVFRLPMTTIQKMRLAARRYVESRFDWAKTASILVRTISSLET